VGVRDWPKKSKEWCAARTKSGKGKGKRSLEKKNRGLSEVRRVQELGHVGKKDIKKKHAIRKVEPSHGGGFKGGTISKIG